LNPREISTGRIYLRHTPFVSFFEPPPPPEKPEPPFEVPEPQAWWHAPRNEIGAPVPLRLVLARTDDLAVAIVGVTAYSTGASLQLAVRWRSVGAARESYLDDHFRFPLGHPVRRRSGGELLPDVLRFGVQFSDGRKATTLGALPWGRADAEEKKEPEGPILSPGGGGGGDGEWNTEFWLWPLPTPGPLTFAVEWPAKGIELAMHEVDSALFIDASAHSETLWPAGPSPAGGVSVSTFMLDATDEEA
jgi:hypothetical protein